MHQSLWLCGQMCLINWREAITSTNIEKSVGYQKALLQCRELKKKSQGTPLKRFAKWTPFWSIYVFGHHGFNSRHRFERTLAILICYVVIKCVSRGVGKVTHLPHVWVCRCFTMYITELKFKSIQPESVFKYMGQQMSDPDSSGGWSIRLESGGWGFEPPQVSSIKKWHFHKNIRSCVENDCGCPRTVNISNVNITSKLTYLDHKATGNISQLI